MNVLITMKQNGFLISKLTILKAANPLRKRHKIVPIRFYFIKFNLTLNETKNKEYYLLSTFILHFLMNISWKRWRLLVLDNFFQGAHWFLKNFQKLCILIWILLIIQSYLFKMIYESILNITKPQRKFFNKVSFLVKACNSQVYLVNQELIFQNFIYKSMLEEKVKKKITKTRLNKMC